MGNSCGKSRTLRLDVQIPAGNPAPYVWMSKFLREIPHLTFLFEFLEYLLKCAGECAGAFLKCAGGFLKINLINV